MHAPALEEHPVTPSVPEGAGLTEAQAGMPAAEPVELFTHLMASAPVRQKKATAAALASSVLFHGAVIATFVWLTLAVGQAGQGPEEQLTLIRLEPEAPPPPPPPPPPPADAPPPRELADVPKGFQTLALPEIIPPDIPPPATGPEILEADFTGEGIEGGRAEGKVVTAENLEAAPVFTPFTLAPVLRNREEVAQALRRFYPPMLRDAGIGGTVLMWFFIDENGKVRKYLIKVSSGHTLLDNAALRVADLMDFSPAQNRDQRVPVWVQLPIHFKAQ
ncbi:MAG: energy transducer TonB [Gemmatimonadetes bacterium]|nr:energy transducer TonB [Gemmatimonadota bacterium]